jgi:chorismate synthase
MSEFEIRPLTTAAQLRSVSTVYQRAFGFGPDEGAIPPKLLLALGQHGGIVLGAFAGDPTGGRGAGDPTGGRGAGDPTGGRGAGDPTGGGGEGDPAWGAGAGDPAGGGGELVGFCYGFLARDPAPGGGYCELYLFSQTAAVLPEYQSSGVGRRLKWAQREHALAAGLGVIRWTFDPLRARNAHVNFDALGASSGTLLLDYYGADAVGRDAGTSSDRLLVDWYLADVRPPDSGPTSGTAVGPPDGFRAEPGTRDGEWLAVPADWDEYRAAVGPEQAQRVRLAVRDELARAFAAGERAVSCLRMSARLSGYRLI